MALLGTITISIDPTIELGPLTLAWHGIMIAVGILVGGGAAMRYAGQRGMSPDPVFTVFGIIAVAGIVGGRLFYLLETDPGALLRPDDLFGTRGFTFNGGLILAAVAIAVYLRRARLSLSYLDIVAVGFPLGVAVGRIGDVINGEHFGPPTNFLLGIRYTHPDAETPSAAVAYHSGGLYEVLLGMLIFALVWPLRHRLTGTSMLMWLVIGLFGVGRFFEFFLRSDSDELALGLDSAQWTSIALVAVAAAGALLTRSLARTRRRRDASPGVT